MRWLRGGSVATKSPSSTETHAMAHNYAINDDVHHQLQGPHGRAVVKQRSVYTIVTCLPIEADGRPRYRSKRKTENIERVVTEEQRSRLDGSARHCLLSFRELAGDYRGICFIA